MDVVYMVHGAERNEELRHSLRSLSNLQHDRVWIVGYKPKWVTGVEYIPVPQTQAKHINTWANLRAIGATAEISDEFALFNDDFFVLHRMDRVPTAHAGPLGEWMAQLTANAMVVQGKRREPPTLERMRRTVSALEDAGRTALISWERHMPMVMDRRWVAEVVAYGHLWVDRNPGPPLCKRTLYGNYAGLAGGQLVADCKIRDSRMKPQPDWPFVSTSDVTFRGGSVGRWLRTRFQQASPYEGRVRARVA